jgi:NAD+ synthase
MGFSARVLEIDPAAEAERIVAMLSRTVPQDLRRHGAVVGVSGGVDSAVVLALCVRAFGPRRVTALIMPERDSSPESERIARDWAASLKVPTVVEPVTAALEGFGCYERRDEAMRRIFPAYDPAAGYKAKIVLPANSLDADRLNVFSLVVVAPDGTEQRRRLGPRELAQIVAASNLKQRARMAMLYYYAELQNFAVIGTANKNEHDQGFFVKHGDGGVDVMPIVHLYKTQVYQLARYLDVPEEIRERTPTSDTYSAESTQEEFFFRLPFELMDLLWYAQEQGLQPAEVAEALDLGEEQVQRAFNDFTRKGRTTAYLRRPPLGLHAEEG